MAAGSTYTPIATQTASGSASSITFSSIASTYTDLVLIIQSGTATAGTDLFLRFNSDSGTNYSGTVLYGTGSTAASSRYSNDTGAYIDYGGTTNTNYGIMHIVNIMNYANTTTYKTLVTRASKPSGTVEAYVNLWRSTAAINNIYISNGSGFNFLSGSTFTLYGITAA